MPYNVILDLSSERLVFLGDEVAVAQTTATVTAAAIGWAASANGLHPDDLANLSQNMQDLSGVQAGISGEERRQIVIDTFDGAMNPHPNQALHEKIAEQASAGVVTVPQYLEQLSFLQSLVAIDFVNKNGVSTYVEDNQLKTAIYELESLSSEDLAEDISPEIQNIIDEHGLTHYVNQTELVYDKESNRYRLLSGRDHYQVGTLKDGNFVPMFTILNGWHPAHPSQR
ncbi:MAG TPA: hypothetical protein VJR27_01830 [Candidatus Saccharimonadales bacterium]|nr:hypothetical protein [Candidatus Saccharimonadales bacterium]